MSEGQAPQHYDRWMDEIHQANYKVIRSEIKLLNEKLEIVSKTIKEADDTLRTIISVFEILDIDIRSRSDIRNFSKKITNADLFTKRSRRLIAILVTLISTIATALIGFMFRHVAPWASDAIDAVGKLPQ